MNAQNIYRKNVERWSKFCPQAASLLFNYPQGDYQSKKFSGQQISAWKKQLDFQNFQLFYIYGITNQLPYHPLRDWLKEENHILVIFEDELEAIASYFKQEDAEEILYHPNVWLFYLDPERKVLEETAKLFSYLSYQCWPVYTEDEKLKIFLEIKNQLDFLHNLYGTQVYEYAQHGIVYFKNFYNNLFAWPKGYLGNSLYNKFKNIPAIICGAGPSLAKNIDVLKQLKDRALIFAGGSTMNGLNAAHMNPHFGLGIDPNEEHITRIIMNTAFEVPFLYRGRLLHNALNLIHGDKIYITGSSGYSIAKYFEESCGIEGEDIEEGCNVINFSLAIAASMGCNPIILVGVDLAYSNNQSYTPGMINHPIYREFKTKAYAEEVIYRLDIYGNTVPTLWKWILESLWFSEFAEKHPEITIINATEGGLGFAGIPNMTLSEVKEKYLDQQIAISCRLFAEIQESKLPASITTEKLIELFKKLNESSRATQQKLLQLNDELKALQENIILGHKFILDNIEAGQEKNSELKKKIDEMFQHALKDELCVEYILKPFNDAFDLFKKRYYKRLEIDQDRLSNCEYESSLLSLEMERSVYLQKTLEVNQRLIEDIINQKEFQNNQPPSPFIKENLVHEPYMPASNLENCLYKFEDNKLTLIDPECELNIHLDFFPEERRNQIESNGKLKFESYYKKEKLHGPSRSYALDGTLLAESWYLDGVQEGKSFEFYLSGALYSIRKYKNGLQHGKQEYYFEDKTPRMQLTYSEGLLNGEVILFHSNGTMARKLHFKNGKHDGPEFLWNESGKLLIEVFYKDNQPVKQARVWHWNGQLAQEVIFNQNSEMTSISYWDEAGQPIPTNSLQKDYFEKVAESSKQFTDNLSNLFSEMSNIAPLLSFLQKGNEEDKGASEEIQALEQKLTLLASYVAELHKMNQQLSQEAGISQGEAFWKTAALQREIEQKLSQATMEMKNQLNLLQSSLANVIKTLAKKVKPMDKPERDKESRNSKEAND